MTTHWPKLLLPIAAGLFLILGASGCSGTDVVHQRSMAELNQKARQLMDAGDINGAIARLESAHDLDPNEPNTTYNLAIAYQNQGSYDKAIELLKQLPDKPGMDKGNIYKTLGITYEAKADDLNAKAKEESEKPKADKAKAEQFKAEADQATQNAIESYQQAIPSLKNPDEVQKQVEALQNRLKSAQNHPSSAPANQF